MCQCGVILMTYTSSVQLICTVLYSGCYEYDLLSPLTAYARGGRVLYLLEGSQSRPIGSVADLRTGPSWTYSVPRWI